MTNFIVEFPLITEKYQEDILNKRFEIGRNIYNSLVTISKKRYKEMIKTRKYRELLDSLTGNKKKDKLIWKEILDYRKQCGMSEYSFHQDVKKMQKHFKEHIDSFTAQKIATELWRLYNKLFYGNELEVKYKKFGMMNSLEGKSNRTGIRFKDDHIYWNGLDIPVYINYDKYYESQALQCDISYCRIVRKYIRNKYKFYVQIVFKGYPPAKINIKMNELKHKVGKGNVGLDISSSRIKIESSFDVKELEYSEKIQNIEKQKNRILKKMHRSRQATNQHLLNQQRKKRIIWKKSNHYIKYQNELRELNRKQEAIIKYQNECIANYIISMGNKVYVKRIGYFNLEEYLKDEREYVQKNMIPKSIVDRIPYMLIIILNRKLNYFGEELIEINLYKMDHDDEMIVRI